MDGAEYSAMPSAGRKKSPFRWILAAAVLLVFAVGAGTAWYQTAGSDEAFKSLDLQPAERGSLVLSITEKGELEADAQAPL